MNKNCVKPRMHSCHCGCHRHNCINHIIEKECTNLNRSQIIQENQVEHTNTERKVLTEIEHPFAFQHLFFISFVTTTGSLSRFTTHFRQRIRYALFLIMLTEETFSITFLQQEHFQRNKANYILQRLHQHSVPSILAILFIVI